MYNIQSLGQVFTPQPIVADMLQLRRNFGRVLEPSCGNGSFSKNLSNCVSVEIDERWCGDGTLNMDFFDYPISEKFDTIIGNPPYVRYQDILPDTKRKLQSKLFDERTNLFLFFIEKSIQHLNDNGELIFITPREFLKATSSLKLNHYLYNEGTITDIIDLGDRRVFEGFSPNCVIFRFERGNFSRQTNMYKRFVLNNGQLLFTDNDYSLIFSDIFFVKVGAVSGNDKIFANDQYGNADFVCSSTLKNGKTRRMIFNTHIPYLDRFKDQLLERKIRLFDHTNWYQWGRAHHITDKKRIYVNCKTRNKAPFFLHECNNYDGAILAIFPRNQAIDLRAACDELNAVNWYELGFVCDGRFIFSQKSLENTLLPDCFLRFTQKTTLF
jgi:adenine-specific DNA-methyltransferase